MRRPNVHRCISYWMRKKRANKFWEKSLLCKISDWKEKRPRSEATRWAWMSLSTGRRSLSFNWFGWKRNPHFIIIVVSLWIHSFGSDTSSICRQKLLASYKRLKMKMGTLDICFAINDDECVHEQMSPNKSDKISFWAPINWSCYVCYVCETFKWKTEYFPNNNNGIWRSRLWPDSAEFMSFLPFPLCHWNELFRRGMFMMTCTKHLLNC